MASSDSSRPTPLGVARARFVDGLVRKAQELRGSLALLAATPSEERPREEMRRRLHALYASAQVFQLEALAGGLKDAIARLDLARDQKRPLSDTDLDNLASLAVTLPALGAQGPRADPEVVSIPSAPPPPAILRARSGRTLQSMPSVVPGPDPDELPPGAPPARKSAAPPAPPRVPAVPHPVPMPPSLAPAGREPDSSLPAQLAASIRADRGPTFSSRAPVLSVLVLDAAEVQAKVRSLLSSERFEVLGAADPEQALRLARSSAPDVVLCDHAILVRAGADFVRRLREDPLTDFVPVVALLARGESVDAIAMRELGAADSLVKPLEAETLEPIVLRLGGGASPTMPGGLGGELTVEQIATRIAEEITRGLVDAADAGRGVSVPLGDGSEVLAAAWSAIGRVRAHLAQRSGGRVHFRERGGAPSTLALLDEESDGASLAEVSLRERRILVVDDDPSVAWFFAGILRECGAIVDEAHDGAEALVSARATRPDVIVTDILMPEVDGFALLRETKRDPVLSDVPVILLSWKEDFLQRMRELQAGASAYLKKEAGAAQVLAAVREVLRPRARLEARVRAGGDVRGRLERIGVIPLLRTVAQLRPDARITVRDAWNLFEVDLRKGQLVDLTRTASDGSFSRGPRVVLSLLGATEGRFTVVDADAPVRASVKEPLDALLVESAAQLGAVVDAVSGRGLALAAKVELDEDVIASMARASPQHIGDVVRALTEGRGPRDLLIEGTHAPHELESVLVDLARQGAITAVLGPGGEDRIEAGRTSRTVTSLPLRTPSLVPGASPEIAPVVIHGGGAATGADAQRASGPDIGWLAGSDTSGDIVRRALARPADEAALEVERLSTAPKSAPDAKPDAGAASDDDASDEAVTKPGTLAAPTLGDLRARDEDQGADEDDDEDATEGDDEDDGDDAEGGDEDGRDGDGAAPPRAAAAPRAKAEPDAERAEAPRGAQKSERAPSAAAGRSGNDAASAKKSARPAARAPSKAPAPPAHATSPDAGLGMVGWGFLVALLVIVGFVGYRLVWSPTVSSTPVVAAPDAGPHERAVTEEPPPPAPIPESPPPALTPSAPVRAGYGTDEPGIDGVMTMEGEGAIVVVGRDGVPATVHIVADAGDATHELRVAPGGTASLAAPAGLYVVTFVVADQTSVRFTRVIEGHTRRLPVPE